MDEMSSRRMRPLLSSPGGDRLLWIRRAAAEDFATLILVKPCARLHPFFDQRNFVEQLSGGVDDAVDLVADREDARWRPLGSRGRFDLGVEVAVCVPGCRGLATAAVRQFLPPHNPVFIVRRQNHRVVPLRRACTKARKRIPRLCDGTNKHGQREDSARRARTSQPRDKVY